MSKLIDRERNRQQLKKCQELERGYQQSDENRIMFLEKQLKEYDNRGIFIEFCELERTAEDLKNFIKREASKNGDNNESS